MKKTKSIINNVKKKLRGSIVHKIYTFLKYDLDIVLFFKIYYNAKRGNIQKIKHFIKYKIVGFFYELPNYVAIDIVSCCNLRCPLCSVPAFITKKASNFMSFDDFKKIVDALDITTNLDLVYAGEPFLHPDFFKMIEYSNRYFYTTTVTNGTLLTGKKIDNIFACGLDFLQISFDGFKKESYEKYRVGANFESVKNNINNFLKQREQRKEKLPHTTITFLINAYNEDEVDDCEKYFLRAGADRFFKKALNLNVHRRTDGKKEEDLNYWLPKKNAITLYQQQGDRIELKTKDEICTICLTPIIRCDGEILLCCHDIFNTIKVGNVFKRDFKEVWFCERYKKLRNLAKHRKLTLCQKCGK